VYGVKKLYRDLSLKSLIDISKNEKKYLATCWLNSSIDIPVSYLDKIIFFFFLGPELSAVYNLIQKICFSLNQILNPLFQVVYPFALNDGHHRRKLNYALLNNLTFIIGLIAVFLIASSISLYALYDPVLAIFFPTLENYRFEFLVFFLISGFSVYITLCKIYLWSNLFQVWALIGSAGFSLIYLLSSSSYSSGNKWQKVALPVRLTTSASNEAYSTPVAFLKGNSWSKNEFTIIVSSSDPLSTAITPMILPLAFSIFMKLILSIVND
jgi:O-antigen/teichoic acid export membrane protein